MDTLTARRSEPLEGSVFAPIVNNLALTGSYITSSSTSEFDSGKSSAITGELDYNLTPRARTKLLMQALDLEGVAVSTGAACSSGSLEPSPVLRAIGFPEGIRVSVGAGNTAGDIDRVLALLPSLVARIKRAQQ